MFKRVLAVVPLLFLFSGSKAQDSIPNLRFVGPWYASPMLGVHQWSYTSIEFGFSRGVIHGTKSMMGGEVHANYFSASAEITLIKKPIYGLELGYWRKLGDQHFPYGKFLTVGIHTFCFTDIDHLYPGFSLPEPAINLSAHKQNPIIFQISYRYRFALRQKDLNGFDANQISIVIYRSYNDKYMKNLR